MRFKVIITLILGEVAVVAKTPINISKMRLFLNADSMKSVKVDATAHWPIDMRFIVRRVGWMRVWLISTKRLNGICAFFPRITGHRRNITAPSASEICIIKKATNTIL